MYSYSNTVKVSIEACKGLGCVPSAPKMNCQFMILISCHLQSRSTDPQFRHSKEHLGSLPSVECVMGKYDFIRESVSYSDIEYSRYESFQKIRFCSV